MWNTKCEVAFEALKEQLVSSPVIGFPNMNGNFVDARDVGVGAVLAQQDEDGKEIVISYASRAFSGSKKNWSTTEKEAYAIVRALQYFQPYAYERMVTIYTDHNDLKCLQDK